MEASGAGHVAKSGHGYHVKDERGVAYTIHGWTGTVRVSEGAGKQKGEGPGKCGSGGQ